MPGSGRLVLLHVTQKEIMTVYVTYVIGPVIMWHKRY